MEYGYYDAARREYVITNPETPSPWINYLGADRYCALVSHNAGGYSFYQSAKSGRFLRFRYNNLPVDRPGRYLYLRDRESGDYWSAAWQPVGKDLSSYRTETRHGLGYTTIISQYTHIESETTYFVPQGEDLEIWLFTLRNKGTTPRRLAVFSYAEFAFWDAMLDLVDYQYILNMCRNRLDNDTQIIDYEVGLEGRPRVFAFTTAPLAGWDCDRDIFMGVHRGEHNPRAVSEGHCFGSTAVGGNPCAAFQTEADLEAGEERTMIFAVGVGRADEAGIAARKRYADPHAARRALTDLADHWEHLLRPLTVAVPDPLVRDTLNVLNPYQAHTTFNWSRSASYYESGTLRDGLGYRDSHQDALAVIQAVPQRVRARILNLAGAVYRNGSACHTYQPLSGTGTGGHDYSDDHLWLTLTTAAYVKETGDLSVLDESVPYFDGGKNDTLFEHLKRTLDWALGHLGPHGLCRGLHADWNDCLNLTGKGESVWTTELLILALQTFTELAALSARAIEVGKYAKARDALIAAVNREAWDGGYYLRAFTDSGRKVGSRENNTGRIFLNPNTWAVICGAADGERGVLAMDAVRERLFTPFGLMLLTPAYREPDPELGAISLFPPSLKENGAVFAHTNPWAVIAETRLGRGDRAFEYFKTLLPLNRNDKADVCRVEPYVFTQFLAGNEHQLPGEGRNSWLTGSASWSYVAGTQYILGIRPDYAGLVVDPCIPHDWDGFEVTRTFRGARYEITVKNPDHVCRGIKEVSVDGKTIEGNALPLFGDRQVHTVAVRMG